MSDIMMWYCPVCGRTVTCPNPTTWTPNIYCPHIDSVGKEYIQVMVRANMVNAPAPERRSN